MKQKEKSKISKDKIISAAIVEFGTKNYENASLNTICNENNISKGLIYHYFKNKDELFLECVRICFHELINYLSINNINKDDFQEMFNAYFQNKIYEGYDFNLLVKDHEINISRLLNIMLYGIIERGKAE